MFYYGLDFHDLAPDSFLHITTFILMCEAFLWVTPHFGLWIKTFEVKPKMIEGQHAECGGASIRNMAGASWPKGSIPEVSALWQQEWFYITAPRSAKWAAAPVFRSGPSTTAGVMDQQRTELGSSQGRALITKPHSRSL